MNIRRNFRFAVVMVTGLSAALVGCASPYKQDVVQNLVTNEKGEPVKDKDGNYQYIEQASNSYTKDNGLGQSQHNVADLEKSRQERRTVFNQPATNYDGPTRGAAVVGAAYMQAGAQVATGVAALQNVGKTTTSISVVSGSISGATSTSDPNIINSNNAAAGGGSVTGNASITSCPGCNL